jgi:hypothetical protein
MDDIALPHKLYDLWVEQNNLNGSVYTCADCGVSTLPTHPRWGALTTNEQTVWRHIAEKFIDEYERIPFQVRNR